MGKECSSESWKVKRKLSSWKCMNLSREKFTFSSCENRRFLQLHFWFTFLSIYLLCFVRYSSFGLLPFVSNLWVARNFEVECISFLRQGGRCWSCFCTHINHFERAHFERGRDNVQRNLPRKSIINHSAEEDWWREENESSVSFSVHKTCLICLDCIHSTLFDVWMNQIRFMFLVYWSNVNEMIEIEVRMFGRLNWRMVTKLKTISTLQYVEIFLVNVLYSWKWTIGYFLSLFTLKKMHLILRKQNVWSRPFWVFQSNQRNTGVL